ncbi:variably expressed lipoprotein and hemagglutinin (VlhA) family protein [Mycoplasmoides gallisepticum str. F]|uniref:VlhA.1.01 variable lipoprotein family protein n=1 Tax=Mycoplasmoides gallisepticum S6 TaxID=1006581 RepID=A0A0F6CK87_MYCGL|nr:FIVAR domain-containing protein [Mycoplasmoides gallisepticum]ADC31565.1 variably expressed lipoprotein and hemagglutinin (VlhA) family protein [Mycoplasmoides gallisepticum str. F]ADC31566.1 variably expressed lipoprotein and hemagglutinin (VlhA) family protein [Mycoplasmoides gallisepticum str. F]AHB99509.1 VlhA.1.01 variable lipoprotein family protein [Mycoplasmoides gallisepticum S6]
MKRKNILKFVSLLGIGSFVMLAAASCTSATTPTPKPESKPNPAPKPDPMPNPPSGGMNGGDTNPGMDTAAQELANAKAALTTLTNSESEKVGLYVDYAKISAKLSATYTTAKNVLNNSASTTQNINAARTTLEAEIAAAAKAKNDFDAQHTSLVKAYNNLKETLKEEKTNLDSLANENYAAIRTNLNSLYKKANTIVTATLDPTTGNIPEVMSVTQANQDIANATSKLVAWKQNADNLANSFIKQSLVKNNLTGVDEANNQEQPGNYSFVGFSVDVNGAQNNNRPNWSFAERKIWASEKTPLATTTAEDATQQAAPLTDVSWIYSLNGAEAKYKLSFRYFGAEKTAYLYFPYKLVKTSDNVGLQYKLNGGDTKQINFVQTPASGSSDVAANEEETMASPAEMQSAPTVDDIKIAKVALSNLNFNSNTIEFSVPTDKVAPMIGNMYLTSSNSEVNKNKIYDDIFGNTFNNENNPTAVTVDLLKGYSLAASHRIYVRQFNELNIQNSSDMARSPTVYLIGLISGNANRSTNRLSNVRTSPNVNGDRRTFTIYVNAPKDGNYSVRGSYLTNQTRRLKFSTSMDNSLTINVKEQSDWNTLGTFDTANNTNIVMKSVATGVNPQNSNTTLHLKKGLNKVIISGTSNNETPYIGNLVFTLSTTPSDSNSNEGSTGSDNSRAPHVNA